MLEEEVTPRRAAPPRPVGPPVWAIPDPGAADEGGFLGFGADLEPATLVDAYRRGIFPWPHEGLPLPWFSPDPRGLLFPDTLHVTRSLRRRLRSCGWTTTVDAAWADVAAACSGPRRGETGTWITPAMRRAYARLHHLGWVHSVEVWDGAGRLVGGLYGVQVGGVFTGESMFHRATDASKVALVDLVDRFTEAGGRVVDVQIATDHLRSLGAVEVPRKRFLDLLSLHADDPVRLPVERRPVDRLA